MKHTFIEAIVFSALCLNLFCSGDDSCDHDSCNDKPPSNCVGDLLRVYQNNGTCNANGQCEYAYEDIPCTNGCDDGRCQGEPCIDVTCDDPPADRCRDENTREKWDGLAGTCVDGMCRYGTDLVTCQNGCSKGQCIGDPCAGVTCNSPGACETSTRARCIDGVCNYPTDTGASCDDGDDCTHTDQCQSDKSCQGTAYACDNPDICTTSGSSACNGDGTCSYQEITTCQNDDTCCPSNCDALNDNDCQTPAVTVHPVVADRIAVGHDHTCVLLTTGNVRCWGQNRIGELGYGHTDDIGDDETPASAGDVDVGGPVKQIAAGQYHTCALLENKGVRCWGFAEYGQLGNGITRTKIGDNETPASVDYVQLGLASQVTAGYYHSCALQTRGNVQCWGNNNSGELGYGDTQDRRIPGDAVNVGGKVAQIAAGGHHTCALLKNGKVRCWGNGRNGELGYANTVNCTIDEVFSCSNGSQCCIGDNEHPASAGDVNVGGTVVQIVAGSAYTCALLDNGRMRCWGHNYFGQLGYGHTDNIGDDETPASVGDVDVGGRVVQMAAGGSITCAVLDTGKVRCWGREIYCRLGYENYGSLTECDSSGSSCPTDSKCCIGDDETPSVAGDVNVGGRVVQVAAKFQHTCVLLDTDDVRCWGYGANGRLGYSDTIDCTIEDTFSCLNGSHCCIGDDEVPAAAGDVPYR